MPPIYLGGGAGVCLPLGVNMNYNGNKILDWFRENRWGHAAHLAEISDYTFGMRVVTLERFLKGMIATGVLKIERGYYYDAKIKRLGKEVFPWEK